MGVKIGTEAAGGFKIGTEIVGGMKVGTEIIYRAVTAPTAYHTYTITTGDRGGIIGYWDNNIGTITNEDVTLSDGSTAEIRQSMVISGVFRFLYRTQNRPLSVFPATITTERAGTSILWTRPSTTQNFGQGTGADYTTTQTSDVATVFQNGVTISIDLSAS